MLVDRLNKAPPLSLIEPLARHLATAPFTRVLSVQDKNADKQNLY